MRTLLAGIGAFRRAPAAVAPLTVEGVVAGALIAMKILPARASTMAAGAVFPLDVYFDVKHWLAYGTGWFAFLVVVVASLAIRIGALAMSLALCDGGGYRNLKGWLSCARLGALAAISFFPIAAVFFAGSAIRYAPFLWVAAPIGLAVAITLCRRAIRLDVGSGAPVTAGLPEVASFMSYIALVALGSAALSSLGDRSTFLAAIFVVCMGPVHALFLLGWRENARAGTYPGGGAIAVAVTVILAVAVASGTIYDRFIRTPPPVSVARSPGTLLLLGGSDSTSNSGALHELDVRTLGYTSARAKYLSYAADGGRYAAADTHRDLETVARRIAHEIQAEDGSIRLLGHSQASLIVDRILADGSATPDAIAIFSPMPPRPPGLSAPPPGTRGVGNPGADSARVLSWLLDVTRLGGFDVDAPAAPVHLDSVVVPDSRIPRLGVWALADSVWLDQDWRRPGELNLVAITDHVGTTRNARAQAEVRRFFEGHSVTGDETSWRSFLVPIVRYAFEPFRPW